MGFFKKFIGVEADKAADTLIAVLIKWDPKGATEAEKRAIAEKLSEFCVICEQSKQKMEKEYGDVVSVKKQAEDKIKLAKQWKAELADAAIDSSRRTRLETSLPNLMKEIGELSPMIDKEVREYEMAKKIFETYDQVVIKTNEKLQQKIEQAATMTSELEMAKAEEFLADQQVNAARVLAGLQTARDSFDVASSVIKKETDSAKARTQAKLREAGLLTQPKEKDNFLAAELAKVSGKETSSKTMEEQIAELENKIK